MEVIETFSPKFFKVSKKTPFTGVFTYILSTYKKINRLKSLILGGYKQIVIVLGSPTRNRTWI